MRSFLTTRPTYRMLWAKFGLTPNSSFLVEHNRETALAILTELLWKDMAYESECMPKTHAIEFAEELLADYEKNRDQVFSERIFS